MKKSKSLFISLTCCSVMISNGDAGEMTPPSAPGDSASGMYTTEAICNRLDSGAEGAIAVFTEPSDTESSGCTLNEMMAKAPAVDDSQGASANEVLVGKTFWGLRSDGAWGPATGTLSISDGGTECSGTMNGTRWCDQGDGTVLDMTTGLTWLQDGDCLGYKKWVNTSNWNDAHTAASNLKDGSCNLSDGSVEGDWHLPTKSELYALANGDEPVRSGTPRAFLDVQANYYWTSTADSADPGNAWDVLLTNGNSYRVTKTAFYSVLPVRGKR